MKHIFTPLFFFLVAIGWINPIQAQVNVYSTYQMPSPSNLSPLFIGSLTESAIYYGDNTNMDTNKPVIVFVHGFVDLNNLWFAPGNDMYMEFHKRRYRTAFTATTRGEGMWYNGEMLSYMLDDITAHYGVNDVVIIAHSNGGKASEVAMFQYGKYNKVDRVITLGTPFRGTGLANMAELPGLNWVADLVGLGGGTSTSTTYYMDGYARPILDGSPDNQPDKFINYGAWGYKHGNSILSPAMTTGGVLLNVMGAGPFNGGNDGVTPYYSSTRPGGTQMWPGHCWTWWCNLESKTDHVDIAYNYRSFSYFEPWLTGSLPLRMAQPDFGEYEPVGNEIVSQHQIIIPSMGHESSFDIDGSGKVSIQLLQKNATESIHILDANRQVLDQPGISKESDNGQSLSIAYELDLPLEGNYELVADSDDFIAVIEHESGPALVLDQLKAAYAHDEAISWYAHMEGTDEATTIKAIITHKNDLKGNTVKGQVYEVEFQHVGNMVYRYDMPQGMTPGTYTLWIQSESEKYSRSIISGFVINEEVTRETLLETTLQLSHYPNPVSDMALIQITKKTEGNAMITLYDQFGRTIKQQDLSKEPIGQQEIQWDLASTPNGTYYLEFQTGNQKISKPLIVLR